MRPTEAHIRPSAIRENLQRLRTFAPESEVCAVVKADGYGHGAVTAATAGLAAGVSWLAVATLEEALALWSGGIEPETPILVLSELAPDDLECAIARTGFGLRLTVGSTEGALAIAEALAAAPSGSSVRAHLKIDTGMHRVGVDPTTAVSVAEQLVSTPGVELEGIWTHLAVADDPSDGFTDEQLARFDRALADLTDHGYRAKIVHAANSAGVIAHPAAHRDLVRIGIAMYGVDPDPALAGRVALRPALELLSRVQAVRTLQPGEGVSYGRRWRADVPTRVATVPVGYADGVRRDSPAAGVEVLIRGRRRSMLGVVTMDQLIVEVDDDVGVGDEVVLIGSQGIETVTANEIAGRLGTIGYEVLTSIGPRIPRRVID